MLTNVDNILLSQSVFSDKINKVKHPSGIILLLLAFSVLFMQFVISA